jgi:hypothetical protein
VVRTSSKVDNQTTENEASDEGDYDTKVISVNVQGRINIRLMMEKTNSARYDVRPYSFGKSN